MAVRLPKSTGEGSEAFDFVERGENFVLKGGIMLHPDAIH
jgi:hypothetical protein